MSDVELPPGANVGRNYEVTDDHRDADRERAYTFHDVLATPRRAEVMDEVADRGAVSIGTLSDILAEHEAGPDYTSQDRKRAYVGLYQGHLPRLDTVGAVDYDDDTGLAMPGPRFDELRVFQRRARGDNWGRLVRSAARVEVAQGRLRGQARWMAGRAWSWVRGVFWRD